MVVFPDGTGPALLTAMIGGIPLNRVHELNLNPGEINFDVTMDNSLKRLPLESTPEYLEVIKTGREQLQILRSTSADKIVNVNDRRYEAERRLVLEKQAKLVEDRGQAKKLQEARRFDEKKRRMERKTTSEVAENEKIMSVLSQTLLGGTLGILGLTGAASFTSRSKEFREDIHNFSSERVKSDVIGDADKSPVEIRNDRSAFGIGEERNLTQISNGELSENEDSLDDVAEAIAAGELHRSLLLNVKDKEDREMIAASAMQDYLNQDDGGEDWLGVISNIIQDDNGDDCDEEAFQ